MENRNVWNSIYKEGRMLSKAPHAEAVSALFKYMPENGRRVLEVGCGSGINLLFAASLGYEVTGIDISEYAIKHANELFSTNGLKANLSVSSFFPLALKESSFDLVIDRGALLCVNIQGCAEAVAEIHRVMVIGGRFLFTPYSDVHSDAVSGQDENNRLIGGYRTAGEAGITGVGKVCYYSASDIINLFPCNKWRILSMKHNENFDLMESPRIIRAGWEIILEKR